VEGDIDLIEIASVAKEFAASKHLIVEQQRLFCPPIVVIDIHRYWMVQSVEVCRSNGLWVHCAVVVVVVVVVHS
jgi:hypothetical protein